MNAGVDGSRPDREFDLPPIDLDHFSFARDLAPNRRRREVTDVDRGADRALAGIEITLDRVEGGVFHHHDHDGSGEYRRQHGVLEAVGEMLRQYAQRERAFCAERNLAHTSSSISGVLRSTFK